MSTIILSIMLIVTSIASIYWSTQYHKSKIEIRGLENKLSVIRKQDDNSRRIADYYSRVVQFYDANYGGERNKFKKKTFEELMSIMQDTDLIPSLLEKRMEIYDKVFSAEKPKYESNDSK